MFSEESKYAIWFLKLKSTLVRKSFKSIYFIRSNAKIIKNSLHSGTCETI